MGDHENARDDNTRWTIRVGTNMNFTPSPGSRIVSETEVDDEGNVEYIVELPPAGNDPENLGGVGEPRP